MKHTQNLSILVWPYRRNSSIEYATLYARLTMDGERAEFSLSRKILFDHWDERNSRLFDDAPKATEINDFIEFAKGEIRQHYYELRATRQQLTAEAIKFRYLGVDSSPKSKKLLQVFAKHVEEMNALVGKTVVKGTYKHFLTTYEKLGRFIKKEFNKGDISVTELKYKFITDFDFFLKTVDNISQETANSHIKRVKKVVNICVKNEWMDRNPFNAFQCIAKEPDREGLNDEEILLLKNKILPSVRLTQVRDIFLFCCYTGYAYAEVKALTRDHIRTGSDGEKWIHIKRGKTSNRENVMLLPIALELIDKYMRHPECESTGKLFPVRSNQKYNDYIKEIADLCGLKRELTTHIARHTFATTITLANDVPIESVSAMLGHKSLRTTQIYAKVVQTKLSNNMKALRDRLASNSQDQTV